MTNASLTATTARTQALIDLIDELFREHPEHCPDFTVGVIIYLADGDCPGTGTAAYTGWVAAKDLADSFTDADDFRRLDAAAALALG